jgi:hypothetical protein
VLEQLVLGHGMAGITARVADIGLNLFHDSPRYFLQHLKLRKKKG